jgi:hypothetical protein
MRRRRYPKRFRRRTRRGWLVYRRPPRKLVYRGRLWMLVGLLVVIAGLVTGGLLAGYLLAWLGGAVLALLAWLGYALRVVVAERAGPGGGGPTRPGGAGVREPRRPLPRSPAGAAALPIPRDDGPGRPAALG